jgi:outer membrane receptor protein involved in Fe transport
MRRCVRLQYLGNFFVCQFAIFCITLFPMRCIGQDGSTSLHGFVEDSSGARIPAALVVVTSPETGFQRAMFTDSEGHFSFGMLTPGRYDVSASAVSMQRETQPALQLHVGALTQVQFHLAPATVTETVTVVAPAVTTNSQTTEVSHEIIEQAVQGLPLNGRRFTDLALLVPGVTQDPRGLTSDSNGDLSFGGVRGYQNNFLVDGADNTNSFFAQARGRYRAPYQFSNEVIKEFRVSSNSYSAELGHAGGAVFNVVTKSGSNDWHGTGFYYLRDRAFDARPAFAPENPDARQTQFGGTFSGPIKRNRAFFYTGFDENLLNVPSIMQFANGATAVVPQKVDYDYKDQALVFAAAQKLNQMAGDYPTKMWGNAAFGKIDFTPSSKQLIFVRANVSRYSGINNVFFNPSSPLTTYAESANGTEDVRTESLAASLTSSWTTKLATHLRAQFSRDVQQSYANSEDPKLKIYNLLDGAGRSSILPRQTREHKLHIADTADIETPRVSWKFGVDFIRNWIYNYFPSMSGGEYYFDNVKVNPFTFAPMRFGQSLTPLRAYAHQVPRYYMQDFGPAESHPDSRTIALFLQDTFRVTRRFTLNAGVRYDRQTFLVDGLVSNPLYTPSGKLPSDSNNFSPRLGFAYSIGDRKPFLFRGGGGRFYSLVPSIYASQVQTDNGLVQSHLFLDLMKPADAALFPKYPNPLVSCPSGTVNCQVPANVTSHLTTTISAFSPNFQTPYTDQASFTIEHELGSQITASASYLYVHGEHLIRSLDANLPKPTITEYPVYNDDGSVFLGDYLPVESFATWQMKKTVDCPFPPCINDIQRPIARLGTINSYQSDSSSVYNGVTFSAETAGDARPVFAPWIHLREGD